MNNFHHLISVDFTSTTVQCANRKVRVEHLFSCWWFLLVIETCGGRLDESVRSSSLADLSVAVQNQQVANSHCPEIVKRLMTDVLIIHQLNLLPLIMKLTTGKMTSLA